MKIDLTSVSISLPHWQKMCTSITIAVTYAILLRPSKLSRETCTRNRYAIILRRRIESIQLSNNDYTHLCYYKHLKTELDNMR